ncbi:diguanylate cyclase [Actinoplanes sp. NPDC023801]|uniref:sensor domain-containing diguanylate cyclase n=1 Tax=Actinoplanes sp. NPDC023801 TaxID=3154595 RepID=UPI0033F17DA7
MSVQLALVLLYAFAAVAALAPARASWRRRTVTPLAAPLSLILVGIGEWAAAQALSVAVPQLAMQVAFSYAIFPGVSLVVAGFYWQSRVYAGYRSRPTRRTVLLLGIEPVLVSLTAATNGWHGLFFTSVEAGAAGTLHLHPGPLYWVHSAYSYLLISTGTLLVIRAMLRTVAGQRRAFTCFLLGGLAPTVANLVTLFSNQGALKLDLTSVAFLVTAGVWWWTERTGINSQPVPVAYQQVLAALGDGVLVVNTGGTVIEANPAAQRLLGQPVVNRAWLDLVGVELDADRHMTLTTGDGICLDVRMVEMRAPDDGRGLGWVVVARDVTELERLRAELTEQTVRDHLTGLYNRRHLTSVLGHAVRAADDALAVVMVDVDHFKSVNDRFGHAVGDRLLVDLAGELVRCGRPGGTVARYGGEEFVVVLPGTDLQAAMSHAEQLRQRCAMLVLDTDHGSLRPTISAGVARLRPGMTAEDLLRTADAALYTAKAAGRNRVEAAQEIVVC